MIWAAYKCTGSLPGQITEPSVVHAIGSKHSSLPASNHLLASPTMSRVQFLHMAPTCRFKRSVVMRFWIIFRVCKFQALNRKKINQEFPQHTPTSLSYIGRCLAGFHSRGNIIDLIGVVFFKLEVRNNVMNGIKRVNSSVKVKWKCR